MKQQSSSRANILVAEDDPDTRRLVSHILEQRGYQVVSVDTTAHAQSQAAKAPPDLIVMDIGMPDMDGLSAIWALRENQELAEIPIIILSAFDSYDLRAEAASAGCQAYITKPFEVSDLTRAIQRALDES